MFLKHVLILFLLVLTNMMPASAFTGDDTLLNASQKVARSIARIEAQDASYKAVIALSPTAEADAKALNDQGKSVLNGMPILVKDNIDTLGLATTAGSLALADNFPDKDAPSIALLKQSGAVILGKTNLSEWANFRSEKSSSGWSAVGGQTANAFDLSRSPCGSSSGSGVAVALGYVDVAIGTETHGSIVCPASANGVVGFKPTKGIVSSKGIVPISSSQDTAGPLANSIENAALVLSAMIDPNTSNYQALVEGLRSIESGPDLKELRIGVLASTQGFDVRRDALLDIALDKLRASGANIIADIQLTPYDGFWDENYQLLQYEFRRDLNHYFKIRTNSLKSMTLERLIAFNQKNAELEMVHFDQNIFEKSQAIKISEEEYQKILAKGHATTRDEGLDKAFAEQKLDAIIGITMGPAWKIDHINGDSFVGPGMSGYPAVAGNPHVTVPGGKIAGMPVGISFVGERHKDHKLAQLIYQFMQL